LLTGKKKIGRLLLIDSPKKKDPPSEEMTARSKSKKEFDWGEYNTATGGGGRGAFGKKKIRWDCKTVQ